MQARSLEARPILHRIAPMLSHSPSQARSWAWPLLIVLFAFWTWLAGKDMSWDVLNHHLYIPYAWWNGRIATDIMGAGPQIYQNPVGYLPFYAMVAADWPAWCIGLAFALLHATNGLFVWLICEELWDGQGDALKGTWLATLLALCAPAFLQFAGTSSIDPLTSSFVLCGFWMAIRSPHASHAWLCCLFSAACVGLAFALKLSNAVFVIALGVTAVAQCASNRLAWSNLTWHAVGGTTSIFLGAGWYSWTLWREFGNPVFPLMNDVFRSDFSPLGAANAERFLPNDMWDLLFRAYDMMRPQAHVYTELFSPDIRLAAAFALGALCVLTLLLRWRFTNSSREGIQPSHWTSKDWDLLTILLTSYAAWMATSGNGRYAAPLLLLVGVLASRIALKTLGSRIGSMIILAVLVIQAAMTVLFGDLRRAPEPWDSSPYYPTVYSEKLKSEPALHVSLSLIHI